MVEEEQRQVVEEVVEEVVEWGGEIEYLKEEPFLIVYHKSLFYDTTMRADF